MKSNDLGKWFEGKVQAALKEIQETDHALFYRFPDTFSAGNPLPSPPGDYLLAIEGVAILIEAKCSEEHDNLRSGFSSLWEKRQAGHHRKWHRAGCPSWVMFCDKQTENVELWDGEQIALCRSEGKRIPVTVEPIVTGTIRNLKQIILVGIEYELEKKL